MFGLLMFASNDGLFFQRYVFQKDSFVFFLFKETLLFLASCFRDDTLLFQTSLLPLEEKLQFVGLLTGHG